MLIKPINVFALMDTMVSFVKIPFVRMVVIRSMVNASILENVYVIMDGKVLTVQNAFRTGIVSTDFVMNPMNANVLMDSLVTNNLFCNFDPI